MSYPIDAGVGTAVADLETAASAYRQAVGADAGGC